MNVRGWIIVNNENQSTQDLPEKTIEADTYENAIIQYRRLYSVDYVIALNNKGYKKWSKEKGFHE